MYDAPNSWNFAYWKHMVIDYQSENVIAFIFEQTLSHTWAEAI